LPHVVNFELPNIPEVTVLEEQEELESGEAISLFSPDEPLFTRYRKLVG
jgi:hypothetical protein